MAILEVHRGVATECPDNTYAGYALAAAQGYEMIELDPNYTKDGELVVLHDNTINRTARDADGQILAEPVNIHEITYEEACRYDYGIYFSPKYKGEPLPLLKEVFDFAEEKGIALKIDNKVEQFPAELKEKLFALIQSSKAVIGLTCSSLTAVREAAVRIPGIPIHYDGPVDEETLKELARLTEKLTVWVPFQCERTSWVSVPFASRELCTLIRRYAALGIWLIACEEDYETVCREFAPDWVETNGAVKPERRHGGMADMHTHSRNSHDSQCPVADMAEAEIGQKMQAFAVTDHCDILDYPRIDVVDVIRGSLAEAGQQERADIKVLRGVEIGDGIWNPKVMEQVLALTDYDVVIGSVHTVRYKEYRNAYSHIDFSKMMTEDIYGYLDLYFEDVLKTMERVPCDIMAHLTCPLRYIVGKYGREVDITCFDDKIDEILRLIIARGIALEVNTSSLLTCSWTMPDQRILRRYRELGGYLVTLGSDAHVASHAAGSFPEAVAMLERIGFNNIYYFEQRRAIPCAIRKGEEKQ